MVLKMDYGDQQSDAKSFFLPQSIYILESGWHGLSRPVPTEPHARPAPRCELCPSMTQIHKIGVSEAAIQTLHWIPAPRQSEPSMLRTDRLHRLRYRPRLSRLLSSLVPSQHLFAPLTRHLREERRGLCHPGDLVEAWDVCVAVLLTWQITLLLPVVYVHVENVAQFEGHPLRVFVPATRI